MKSMTTGGFSASQMRAPLRQPEVDNHNNLAATPNFLHFFGCQDSGGLPSSFIISLSPNPISKETDEVRKRKVICVVCQQAQQACREMASWCNVSAGFLHVCGDWCCQESIN
jgi:hypothetical protein